MPGRSLSIACFMLFVVPLSMAQWSSLEHVHPNPRQSELDLQESERVQFQAWVNSIDLRRPSHSRQPTISAAQLKIPRKAQKSLEKAREAFRKGKLDEMERHLANALTISPRYSDALAFRAAIELTNQAFDLAKADAEAAVEYDPNCAAAYLFLGSTYSSLGNFDDAIRVLSRALSLNPDDRWNYYEIGRALLYKGDYSNALLYADKALALSEKEDSACMHLLKAAAYVALRNQTSANQELQRIQQIKPVDPDILERTRILERIMASGDGE